MILSRRELLKALKAERIRITPFDASCVGACSIDLHLGNEFRIFKKTGKPVIVREDTVFPSRRVVVRKGGALELKPLQFVLGVTKERIRLSSEYCARIDGRSRFARLGLMVHVSSSLIHPGSDNVQVLEIVNLSPQTLKLRPGTKICQVVFERLSSPAEYHGRFKKQNGL
ncbi:MAG: dCTP deaminase [Candidatus Micrarchaeota archaeon]